MDALKFFSIAGRTVQPHILMPQPPIISGKPCLISPILLPIFAPAFYSPFLLHQIINQTLKS